MNQLSNDKYKELLELQERINEKLQKSFIQNMDKSSDFLSAYLIRLVENITEELNRESDYNFGRCDYSGDVNYQNSEQTYSCGEKMGKEVILHFHGFSVQVSWES